MSALRSSVTPTGPDLGSSQFHIIKPVKPLILAGKGTSSYQVGETWHLLDQRLRLAAPIMELHRLDSVKLNNYTHLLLPDGTYDSIDALQKKSITSWVKSGGILISVNRAANWAESLCFKADKTECEDTATPPEEPPSVTARAYGDFANDRAQQVIGGAIVASILDLSHPLTFGYQRPELPLLRRGTTLLKDSENAYATPLHFANSPLMAGFIGKENLDAMGGQAALIAEKQGQGLLVRFAINPLFRGFWRGTERLYINALYFGSIIGPTELPNQTAQDDS